MNFVFKNKSYEFIIVNNREALEHSIYNKYKGYSYISDTVKDLIYDLVTELEKVNNEVIQINKD